MHYITMTFQPSNFFLSDQTTTIEILPLALSLIIHQHKHLDAIAISQNVNGNDTNWGGQAGKSGAHTLLLLLT